jgi:hypothetical protein
VAALPGAVHDARLGPFDKLEFLGGAVYGQPGRRLLARLAEPVVVCQRKQAAMADDGD